MWKVKMIEQNRWNRGGRYTYRNFQLFYNGSLVKSFSDPQGPAIYLKARGVDLNSVGFERA